MNKLPTQERLQELFEYKGGRLYRKRWNGGNVKAGEEAGCLRKSKGYRCVSVDNVLYQEHRLIWKMFYGKDPDNTIDHINGNRSDNQIENLRDVLPLLNSHNRGKGKTNTSGYLGVSFAKREGKFKAQMCFNGKRKQIGLFETAEDAARAYQDYKQVMLNSIKENV